MRERVSASLPAPVRPPLLQEGRGGLKEMVGLRFLFAASWRRGRWARFGRNTEAGPQNFALERSLKCWRHYHGDDDDCPVAARLDQLPFLPRSRECHRGGLATFPKAGDQTRILLSPTN
jgi:hypothetical protein